MLKSRLLKVMILAALVVALVAVAAPPSVAKAATSCPSTVATHFLGTYGYSTGFAYDSWLVSSSGSGGNSYCKYYSPKIVAYTPYGNTTYSGYWSAYAWQL